MFCLICCFVWLGVILVKLDNIEHSLLLELPQGDKLTNLLAEFKRTLQGFYQHFLSLSIYDNHHYHPFLTPAIWRRWVRMNYLHCPRSFVKSIASLNVGPIDSISNSMSNSKSNDSIYNIRQGCTARGPRAGSGPERSFIRLSEQVQKY